MAKFKKGDKVFWSSQANGYTKEKRGEIVAVVRKRNLPAQKLKVDTVAIVGRDHESYVVKVGRKHYWPLVKYIQAA